MKLLVLLIALASAEYTIHFVPHSHTDAGWIETIDWYYDMWVRNILSSVVPALESNSERKFVWADTNYLAQWMSH